MALITPNFNFDGHCAEAIALYQRAFGAQVHQLILCRDAVWDESCRNLPEERQNQVYHAELFIGEQRIMLCDNPDVPFEPSRSLSLMVTLDTKEQVLAAYEALAEGGEVIYPPHATPYSSCFASLVDRFGFRWGVMTEQTER